MAVREGHKPGANYSWDDDGTITYDVDGVIDILADGALEMAGTAVTSTAAELNILDGVTSTAAELNILDGVTSTAAELNLLDGSLEANSAASVAPILDTGKALRTNANVGTPGSNCTAVEYGDGFHHLTVLTLTAAELTPTIPADAEGAGVVVYTFPAGVYSAIAARGIVTAFVADAATNAAEFGLGSVIASGDVAALDTPATFEDWLTGQTIANVSSPAMDKAAVMTAGAGPVIFEAGDSHVLNFNAAGTWNGTISTAAVTGTVTIHWVFLGA